MKRVRNFAVEVAKQTFHKVKSFLKGAFNHAESIILLSLSALGLNSLLGELPFLVALPAWIEWPLIIPVIAVLTVSALSKMAEKRAYAA